MELSRYIGFIDYYTKVHSNVKSLSVFAILVIESPHYGSRRENVVQCCRAGNCRKAAM